MRVLIAEDDAETAAYIVDGLKQGGHWRIMCRTDATPCSSPRQTLTT